MYNHQGTITVETDRLILRQFSNEDASAMFHSWSSDEAVAQYMRWDAHKSIEETERIISAWINDYERFDFYLWAITLKETNELIGSIGMFSVNTHDMCYEVAYNIGRYFWNRGYVSEALKSVLRFGLQQVGINRIEAYHSINNPASGKVMLKSGMRFEGRARQKYRSHAGFEDCDLYAILKDDVKDEGAD